MKTMSHAILGVVLMVLSMNAAMAEEKQITWPAKDGTVPIELVGLSKEAVKGLHLVKGGVLISGFCQDDSDAISVTMVRVPKAPVSEDELTAERGRLKPWAYGLLLERFDGQDPIRLGGALEPFLSRLAKDRGRTLCLQGFWQSGTFCVVAASLQDELHY